MYHIIPSVLSANMMELGKDVEQVVNAGADMIHVDMMDNHYVPNLTFGPLLCQHLHKAFPLVPLDIHLMVTPVDALIEQCAKAGASRISIHPEATLHLDRSLAYIQELGCQAGLVLNPATSIEWLTWVINRLDFVLVMTVNPGFSGQKLIEAVMPKIATIHKHYPHLPICVDGGINPQNIATLARRGATQFIAGSAIFDSNDYKKTIALMRKQLTFPKL